VTQMKILGNLCAFRSVIQVQNPNGRTCPPGRQVDEGVLGGTVNRVIKIHSGATNCFRTVDYGPDPWGNSIMDTNGCQPKKEERLSSNCQ